MDYSTIAGYRNRIDALRRSKAHKSAERLVRELESKIDTAADREYVAYVICGQWTGQELGIGDVKQLREWMGS